MTQLETPPGPRLKGPRRLRFILGGVTLALGLIGVGALLASANQEQHLQDSIASPSAGPASRQVADMSTETSTAPKPETVAESSHRMVRGDRPERARDGVTRFASAVTTRKILVPATERSESVRLADEPDTLGPIEEAKRAIASCRSRFEKVQDYTCVFFKRERLADGRMTSQHVMRMKGRTEPRSVYFKFLQPKAGREAIWVENQYDNKAIVHDVGFGKLLIGTLRLDPTSRMAMEDCRHPITDAGLGHLIEEIEARWEAELTPGESIVTIHRNAHVGDRACTLIESVHPKPNPDFLFHKVNVYIDQELNLPIRFEAYDWPSQPGGPPELVEEYTYTDLKLNSGLTDRDFDPGNRSYSFGRF